MRYASVCSGVEAASLAWMGLGWRPVFFSEVEKFPCEVLRQRFPGVPNLGDMTKIKGEEYNGSVDLLVGGTPCFAKGTMVLTENGYVPIEEIKVGDYVVSHRGNLCKVLRTGNKVAEIGKARVIGRPAIECTPNHPFLSYEMGRDYKRGSETYGRVIVKHDCEFRSVSSSAGRYAVRLPIAEDLLDSDDIPEIYNALPEDVVELAGWYIGDGYIRRFKGKEKKSVVFCLCSDKKIIAFTERFSGKINFCVSSDGKVTVSNTELADWLLKNFGEHSLSKKIPYWIYYSCYKEHLIDGYQKTDGCVKSNGRIRITTASKALAYGIADLLEGSSVLFQRKEKKCVIEGRSVNQHDYYDVEKVDNPRKTILVGNTYVSKIRSFDRDGTNGTVYNIEVERDHSYIVSGIAVHNCQGFSVAGEQGGLNDGRSVLALSYVELLRTMRPRWFVWENVPGVFSTNGGRDFKEFIRQINEIGYCCGWRVLDAQYVRTQHFPRAVPQRRRRVFVVGHSSGDWRYPASVLFEPEMLLGNPTPRRVKGKGFTSDLGAHFGVPGSFNGFNFEMYSGECKSISPTLQRERAEDSIVYTECQSIGNGQLHSFSAGKEIAQPLNCMHDHQSFIGRKFARRFTPLECERLMGFPDNWTRIPWGKKEAKDCPDSPRYKACGNSMCVNCMEWIGQRIEMVERSMDRDSCSNKRKRNE